MDVIFVFENKRLNRTVNKRYMLICKNVGILTKQNSKSFVRTMLRARTFSARRVYVHVKRPNTNVRVIFSELHNDIFILSPPSRHLTTFNNRSNRTRCEICSLNILLLLTLTMKIPAGYDIR